jgi:putative transposase
VDSGAASFVVALRRSGLPSRRPPATGLLGHYPDRTLTGKSTAACQDTHRDSKCGGAFEEIFRSEGVRIVRTPIRAPNANAYAERWVGTLHRECLDRILIINRRQLEHVLRLYTDHYNRHRPHQSLSLRPPDESTSASARAPAGCIRKHELLGGLINEYEAAA